MAEKVGFVGLGIMGAAMAKNLLGAGHDLVVHNRTREKAEALEALGAEVSASPGEAARQRGGARGALGAEGSAPRGEVARNGVVVIPMLPGPPEVRQVVAGEDGLLDS